MKDRTVETLVTIGIVIFMILSVSAAVLALYELGARQNNREVVAKQFLLQLRKDIDRHEAKIKELETQLPKLAPPKNMKTTFYGKEFQGKKMANGQPFDMRKKTVAHRTLPLGSIILMEYHGRHDFGEVTDRGPAEYTGNELDVSERLAGTLGMLRVGHARVKVTRLN